VLFREAVIATGLKDDQANQVLKEFRDRFAMKEDQLRKDIDKVELT
jgi:hypothetical protein